MVSRIPARSRAAACPADGRALAPSAASWTGYATLPTVKIASEAAASAATASAAASHWTARGAGLPVVRKTPQMPMKPRTAIWMVCQPRADAESSSRRSAGEVTCRAAPASLGSICASYPPARPLCTEPGGPIILICMPEPTNFEGPPAADIDMRCHPADPAGPQLIAAASRAASTWSQSVLIWAAPRHNIPEISRRTEGGSRVSCRRRVATICNESQCGASELGVQSGDPGPVSRHGEPRRVIVNVACGDQMTRVRFSRSELPVSIRRRQEDRRPVRRPRRRQRGHISRMSIQPAP